MKEQEDLIRVYGLLEQSICVDGQEPKAAFTALSVGDVALLPNLHKALDNPNFRVQIVVSKPQAALYTMEIKNRIGEHLSPQ